MNRKQEFLKNTILLAVGRFSTQLVSFLCIPIYTHYLVSDDYGLIDLYQTIISFFIPIISLRLDIAAFRFLSEHRNNEDKKQDYLNSIFLLLIATSITTILIGVIVNSFIEIKYFPLVLSNLITLSLATVLQHSLRGLKLTKDYSICSLLTSASLFLITVLLIVCLKQDGKSILIASILSNTINIVYSLLKLKPKLNKSKRYLIKDSKEVLSYSTPMILDATSWWIVSTSDRAIISYFIGVAANGIYSVSCKISNILNSLFLIFNLSWQEAVISHKDDDDGSKYLSELGNGILKLFLALSVLILALTPLIFDIVIGNEFADSYNYIPVLIYANIFSIISTLTGSILVIYKETRTIARTTVVAAIINAAINILLIRYIGIHAATISTLISYAIIALYRYYECKKFINFKLNIKTFIFYTVLYIGCCSIYVQKSTVLSIICSTVTTLTIAIMNREMIISIFQKVLHK